MVYSPPIRSADSGNRTHILCLGGVQSTFDLYPLGQEPPYYIKVEDRKRDGLPPITLLVSLEALERAFQGSTIHSSIHLFPLNPRAKKCCIAPRRLVLPLPIYG